MITEQPQGTSGFGYDPVFLVPEKGKTLAEMTAEEKNQVSHRARAFQRAKELLQVG
jgi:XTP/dITP diphosphohydrolase